ncbi:MAG TPA: TIGR00730 family Rossman fold protein [Blastocatellia bacterium]|nr:TIGR00730 family Rossman fold protein [Blastocatellia bacterium]
MKRICVYCGSSNGARPSYIQAARALGTSLVRRGIGLVYGGSNVGLMGALADTVLAQGGEVIGVIPESVVIREVAHTRLADLRVVGSMHERKALMAELADGFIAMPGGFGTLEEFCEIVTWVQLGLHRKPCGLLNVEGYYDGLLSFLNHAVAEGFIRTEYRSVVLTDSEVDGLLEKISTYEAPHLKKWIDRDET